MGADASTSKKRSGASSLSRPPEPTVFFVDRSLGKIKVATALRQAGAAVEVHDDRFPPDSPDEDWLKVAGERRWVVLTKDDRIRYHRREMSALWANNVRAFVLTARSLSGDEMGQAFCRALKKMNRFVAKFDGPFIAGVDRNGNVRMIRSKE